MNIGIMQPYFFPYIAYWQLIAAVDVFVIYDDINYIKNGWINRNNILLNGQKHLITIPLSDASPFKPINETKITSNIKDKEKILKTIKYAYSKSTYYKEVFSIIEQTIMHESQNISEATTYSIKKICQYLDIKTDIRLSSSISKNNELKGYEKVIQIVKLFDGTNYINAIGGLSLYSKNDFAKEGILLNFIKTLSFEYQQFDNEFVPNLSIIDIMMFNGKEEIKRMLGNYELI